MNKLRRDLFGPIKLDKWLRFKGGWVPQQFDESIELIGFFPIVVAIIQYHLCDCLELCMCLIDKSIYFYNEKAKYPRKC